MNFSPSNTGTCFPILLGENMVLKHLDKKNNTNTVVLFKCDKCSIEYERINKNYFRMKKNPLYDQDYCRKCWTGVVNNSPEYKKTMSKAIRKMYIEHPEIRDKISKTSKERKVNCGDKNGMKQLHVRKKVSAARKRMFQDPKIRQHYAQKTREAWARGDFEGVRVGQCKWHDYLHRDGEIYKVQGTWELAFIKWIDKNELQFKCHKGRIPYTLDGVNKNYYPDFWINEWNSYAEVKCKHFYVEDKFNAIRESNPGLGLKILFRDDLIKLGVDL